MNQEMANYLFLHRELINVMNCAFVGYPDGYFFVPPNSYITDRYERLLDEYLNLEINRNRRIEDEIATLPLVSLKGIRSLSDQFDENIPLWRSLKDSLDQDIRLINKLLPADYVIPDKLRVIAYELKDALLYHEQKKQKLLIEIQPHVTKKTIVIDKTRSLLVIGEKSYQIELMTKPFIFLDTLLSSEGVVVSYKDLASVLELNSSLASSSNDDVKREVQGVKKDLLNKLHNIGISSYDVSRLSKAILSIKKLGYRLDTISL